MIRLITLLSSAIIATQAYAQNKIPQNSYKNHSELEAQAVERLRALAVDPPDPTAGIYQFQTPVFFNAESALLAKINECGSPESDTIYTLADESFAHLEKNFFLDGWKYALQDCWVFVNRIDSTLSNSDQVTSNRLYFQSIEFLQSKGLLKTNLINAKLRGSGVVHTSQSTEGLKTITAFRIADLHFYR